MSVKLEIFSTGTGLCALTGREGDGVTLSFDDQTVVNAFLTWRALRQMLGMKAGQVKPELRPASAVPLNGPTVAAK